MRLLAQISRKYGDTEYKKHWIVIPNKIVERLHWKAGMELEMTIRGRKLIIERD